MYVQNHEHGHQKHIMFVQPVKHTLHLNLQVFHHYMKHVALERINKDLKIICWKKIVNNRCFPL